MVRLSSVLSCDGSKGAAVERGRGLCLRRGYDGYDCCAVDVCCTSGFCVVSRAFVISS